MRTLLIYILHNDNIWHVYLLHKVINTIIALSYSGYCIKRTWNAIIVAIRNFTLGALRSLWPNRRPLPRWNWYRRRRSIRIHALRSRGSATRWFPARPRARRACWPFCCWYLVHGVCGRFFLRRHSGRWTRQKANRKSYSCRTMPDQAV